MPWHWYEDYERGRPGYPQDVVNVAGVPASATALEIAAGTGKLTRLLVPRFARVVAVEPDAKMRRVLVERCPEAEVIDGSAERIPLADASVDAVFTAQAFHWFDNERALAEIARVLRRRGALVAMWNVPTGPPAPPIPAVEQVLGPGWPPDFGFPLDLSLSSWAPQAWQLAFTRSVFEEHRELRLDNPQTVDPEGFLAFFGSMGWIASLPDQERLLLAARVRSLLTADQYVLPWETRVHWTRLLASPERSRA